MNTQEFVVIGGRGKTGYRVADRLTRTGLNVRVASRGTAPCFNWADRSTWAAAIGRARSAYVAYQPDLAAARAATDVADFAELGRKLGLRHIVLLSARGGDGALLSEARLRGVGIDYTILRSAVFMQNFSEGPFLDGILAGELALPADMVPEPFVDAEDVADAAYAALTNGQIRNRTFELTGAQLFTFAEAVHVIATASNRDITYSPLSIETFLQIQRRMGLPDETVRLMEELFTQTLDGRNAAVSPHVQRLTGHPPRTFEAFARCFAAPGTWRSSRLMTS